MNHLPIQAQPILRIALPLPIRRLFDYLSPQPIDLAILTPGVRVLVPFQSRELVGVLIEVVYESSLPINRLKSALTVLDKQPLLSADVSRLCHWAADYYHYALGEVLLNALPPLLRKANGLVNKSTKKSPTAHQEAIPVLNNAQSAAVEAMTAAKDFNVFLLHGITGSGKTEVYLRMVEYTLKQDKQVLVLIPEIGLTPQLVQRFNARFTVPIVYLHSNVSAKARVVAWEKARSGEARIVIGTRSAIFTSFASLGLIVVDEEHDGAFKQQDRFRYHARDLAILRASINKIPIVLGSATPSLESMLNAKRNRYHYLVLAERAGEAKLASYQLIDIKNIPLQAGLSAPLLNTMKAHLADNNQVMLFLNRRGFAPVLYCMECTKMVECERCDARMVYHELPPQLVCHHCQSQRPVPMICTACHAGALKPVGVGTQRIEQLLEKLFTDVPIIRVDRDNTKHKGAMENLLIQINQTPKAILLGTQMLAKGHHFPRVTLVGIVDADSGFFSADFRASEQMGQLLLQVAGRAGRAEKAGTVMVQTQQMNHPFLTSLLQQDYLHFSHDLLNEREQAALPPFTFFALLRVEAYKEKNAIDFLMKLKEKIRHFSNDISLSGPVPALLAKRKGLFCQHLIIKAKKRAALQFFLKQLMPQIEQLAIKRPIKWMIDVDPMEI